jgi:hypothetical protein
LKKRSPARAKKGTPSPKRRLPCDEARYIGDDCLTDSRPRKPGKTVGYTRRKTRRAKAKRKIR